MLAAHDPAAIPGEPNPSMAAVAPAAPVATAVAAAAPTPAVTATGSTVLDDDSLDGFVEFPKLISDSVNYARSVSSFAILGIFGMIVRGVMN